MPGQHTVHCGICGKPISGGNFFTRMKKLREHRKKKHPKAHKKSVKKAAETRSADPVIHVRRKLVERPNVKEFKDYGGQGLIRLLYRADETVFPEFALYVKFRGLKHRVQDRMLKDADLVEESNGKWVLRSDRFSIFVYVR